MVPHWVGDVASLATLIGLGLTFWQSYKAKTAAELTRTEVESFRSALALHDLAADCSAATEALEAILQDHREQKWDRLLDRYSRLRRSLSALKEAGPGLAERERALIQEALLLVVRAAERIEDWSHRPIDRAENARMTKQVAGQRDKLSSLLGRLRQRIGEEPS